MFTLTNDEPDEALALLTLGRFAVIEFEIVVDPAVVAAVGDGETPWRAVLMVEDTETGDGRFVVRDAITWRDLPVSLAYQYETPSGFNPHGSAFPAGRIDTITRAGTTIKATGVFTADDEGRQAALAVDSKKVRGVSVDLDNIKAHYELIEDAETGEVVSERYVLDQGRIMGATIVMHPAFAEAIIETTAPVPPAETEAVAASLGEMVTMFDGVIVDGERVDVYRAAFADPQLESLTPFTVVPLGNTGMACVYGHIAPWGVCHLGIQHRCQTAPQSKSGYSYFHLGQYECVDGPIAVGKLSMGGLHADRYLDRMEAQRWYDDMTTVACYVRAGEDEWGIWVAGITALGLSAQHLEMLAASCPSGDWRPVGMDLELCAVHEVVAPGFPVPRNLTASAAFTDGAPASFISGGVPRNLDCGEFGQVAMALGTGLVIPEMADVLERLDRIERNQRAQMRFGITLPEHI